MNNQAKNNIDRKARFVKQKHKQQQNTSLKERSTQRARNNTWMVGKLVALNKYKKLVVHTTDEKTIEKLYEIDDAYKKNINECKTPVSALEHVEGLTFKVSIPQFLHNDLFDLNDLVGKDIKIQFHAKTYSGTSDFGTGYYFTLAGMPMLVEP